jgi:NAD(P)-dependent dehydrogenase (short-subunit alcohol dehydrogenase family)
MRTAVISGASAGIGKAIADIFLRHGFRVFTISRRVVDSPDTNQIHISKDLSDWNQCIEAAQVVSSQVKSIDILVNNVGKSEWRSLENVDFNFFNEMMQLNVASYLALTKSLLPLLARGSVITNISSMAGKRGSKNNSVYCASKFAINGLTQSWAKELGPLGIRVNAICPVLVGTNGLHEALARPDAPAREAGVDAFLRGFTDSQSALGTLPSALDVAEFCFYLSSASAQSISGQCINIDCGVFPQ